MKIRCPKCTGFLAQDNGQFKCIVCLNCGNRIYDYGRLTPVLKTSCRGSALVPYKRKSKLRDYNFK